jgi:membrane-bound inhibitor of C-type lysozyme
MLKKGIMLISICLVIFGCSDRKANHSQSPKAEVAAKNAADTLQKQKIVTATLTNTEGSILKLKFSQAAGTCEAEFNGKTIMMKQQPMASGIKYSNDHYEYTEWHGEVRLYKNGKLVFSHDQ